jgi:hypothetical protein
MYFITNFSSDKIEKNEMGGSNDKYTGEEKFLLVFDGEA